MGHRESEAVAARIELSLKGTLHPILQTPPPTPQPPHSGRRGRQNICVGPQRTCKSHANVIKSNISLYYIDPI